MSETPAPDADDVTRQPPQGKLPMLAFSALGIVFGDIGTSPLYTFKTILGTAESPSDPATVLGALSLVLWTLFIITTVKYVSFAMRVDNDGEGGILALMALLGVKKQQPADHRRGRPVRGGVDLWRWRDHAGDFGAVGAGGVEHGDAGAAALCRSRRGRDPARAVCDPVAGNGRNRAVLRADHAALVSGDGGDGDFRHRAASGRVRRAQSGLRPVLSVFERRDRLSGAGRGVSLRHRRRGALCGYGPFRQRADQAGLVRGGVSEPDPELCRAGRAGAGGRADRRQYLLPAVSPSPADTADRAGDHCDHHRQPVDHHRRVLDDAAGDPARLDAAALDQADLLGRLRADLRRRRQLAVDDRDRRVDHRCSASRTIWRPPTASPFR